MSMKEIGGAVPLHKCAEGLESRVGQALSVAQAPGRGVGDQHVEAPAPQELEPETQDSQAHLLFRVLMRAGLIAHGTAQAQKTDAPVDIDPILDADTALRRCVLIAGVMVSVDVKDGTVEKGSQKEENNIYNTFE